MTKKTAESKFIIEFNGQNSFDAKVSVKIDDEDTYGEYLGKIVKSHTGEEWRWVETRPEELLTYVRNIILPTEEIAASFLYAIKQRSDAYCKAHPIPQDLSQYLERKARDLQEIDQKLLHQFWEVRNDRYMLHKFAERYGMERIQWYTEGSDKEETVKRLLEFSVFVEDEGENKEVPFFSEVALYNLIGKEDARTVLSLVKDLCNSLAPNVAADI